MFDKLIGNNHIKDVLRRLLISKRVPNALLFAGADGVGKKQFALELAKAFVCLNPKSSEACDVCPACRRADIFKIPEVSENTKVDESLKDKFKTVFFSAHGDIGMVVPLKKNVYVDAIRNLEKEANFNPFEAAARFFIIDDADKMSDAPANALLKTLEEPPATSHIFLITSRPDTLLPTIRSRCQTLRFAPVDVKEIENYLVQTKNFAPADAALSAKLSGGKLGNALETDLEKFRVSRAAMLKVLESILIKENRAELLRVAEEMNDAKNKDDYEARLDILQTLIHDVWAICTNADAKLLINLDIIADLRKFAENAESRKLAAWLAEIETVRGGLAVNLNRKIATDALFMQMANG
ncbi:MAG: DNA polymerase III subunit delta' [Pyrinomonadaceae bacterium]|nr:DNA polymerase III subunit delta' [Pyrinomonadaceae bacterium]